MIHQSDGLTDGHRVQFYEHESYLYDRVSDFMSGGLRAGDAAVVIATPEHRIGVESTLRERGIDVGELIACGRFYTLDAAATLAEFMVDGWPDPRRFAESVGGAIRVARGANDRRVLLFGEMVALLHADGKDDAALRLEELWNELARTDSFGLFCAYPLRSFDQATHARSFGDIVAAHSAVVPSESDTEVRPDERGKVIAALQQKAAALEAETRERAALEAALRSKISELA